MGAFRMFKGLLSAETLKRAFWLRASQGRAGHVCIVYEHNNNIYIYIFINRYRYTHINIHIPIYADDDTR